MMIKIKSIYGTFRIENEKIHTDSQSPAFKELIKMVEEAPIPPEKQIKNHVLADRIMKLIPGSRIIESSPDYQKMRIPALKEN